LLSEVSQHHLHKRILNRYNDSIELLCLLFLGESKMIKHIFSDMDGTLLDSQGNVSDTNANAVKDSGIPFTLVSARAPMEMEAAITKLGLTEPQIGFNGGLIYQKTDNGFKVLNDNPLNMSSFWQLMKVIQNNFSAVSCSCYGLNEWYAEKIDSGIEYESKLTGQKATVTDFDKLSDTKLYKIMMITFDLELMNKLNTALLSLHIPDVSIKRSGDNYLEITSNLAQKSKGIKYIQKLEKLAKEDMAAFGNGHNDLPMLTNVGWPIVMDNAPDEIKQYGKYITKSNDNNGVAYGINHLLS
jgi:HAD-superfamily hydrolase, subfamily IIB